jgi:hypothetical protein
MWTQWSSMSYKYPHHVCLTRVGKAHKSETDGKHKILVKDNNRWNGVYTIWNITCTSTIMQRLIGHGLTCKEKEMVRVSHENQDYNKWIRHINRILQKIRFKDVEKQSIIPRPQSNDQCDPNAELTNQIYCMWKAVLFLKCSSMQPRNLAMPWQTALSISYENK